jgi:ABC-type lipoprotein release transport system permease subunit
VINEAFARRFFDRRNPIGLRVTVPHDDGTRTSCQVVGVARDARTQGLRVDVRARYFVPSGQAQSSPRSPTFFIRSAADAPALKEQVRKTIQQASPGLPVLSIKTIEEQMAPLTAQDRTTAQLVVVFGSVALLLAAIGLYGVISYGVERRTGEIAVRIVLGAQAGRVVMMILRETTGVVGVGLAIGGGLAFAASRLVEGRLYGVEPHDPLALGLAIGLLVFVALSATYLPARRASRLDPMAALRK